MDKEQELLQQTAEELKKTDFDKWVYVEVDKEGRYRYNDNSFSIELRRDIRGGCEGKMKAYYAIFVEDFNQLPLVAFFLHLNS